MWKIQGRGADGKSREVKFIELESSSRPLTRIRFRDVMGGKTSELFDQEMESPDPLPGVDGIESWGGRAAEMVGGDRLAYGTIGKTDKDEDVPGLTFTHGFETAGLAFHSPEVLLADVSGITDLEISADHPPLAPTEPFTLAGSVLESRIYSDGAVIESEAESEPDKSSFHVSLSGSQGGLIARVANWLARPFKGETDPFMQGRLKHYEDRYPVIAKHYPDISLAAANAGLFRAINKAPVGTAVIVFVHGTYSCAVPHLALLHPLKLPAYRFEHDTFKPVTENKNRLVQAVAAFIPKGARLYLVAHSRGGLVSRLAARDLLGSYDVQVLTYGTPHRGTPLANAAKRLFTAMLAGGRAAILAGGGAAVKAIFSWDPPSLAGKLLLKGILPSGFPAGLDAMRPESDFTGGLSLVKEPFPMRTWGARCDVDQLPSGAFAFAIREAIKGAFSGAANDTVVGAGSATGAGTPQKVLEGCTHFQYFSDPGIRSEIQSLV